MMYYCAKGDEEKFAAEMALRDRHHGKHLPPVSWCMRQWELGHEFLNKCKVRLQAVVVACWCACSSKCELVTHPLRHACVPLSPTLSSAPCSTSSSG